MFEEVFSPDPKVKAILRNQRETDGEKLRWSAFLFPFRHRGERYLYHTLTKQCLRVDEALEEALRAGGLPREAEELRALRENWFLVPESRDEAALFEGLQRLLRLRTAQSRLSSCTILTTTACNARCFYCVEQGMRTVTMEQETAEQTLAFLLRNRDPEKKLHLIWFGGEPLAAPQVIQRISEGLAEQGVDFDASILTNGILIDEKMLAGMTGPWRVRSLKITLDGSEEEYNRRKNYRRSYPSAFRELLEVLRRLMDSPIRVTLRCNVDRNNAEGLERMVDELALALPRKEHFFPYFTLLYAERDSEEHAALFHRCLEAKVYARDKGFPYVPQSPLHRFRPSLCMAENPFGCTVVDPEGQLFNCDMMEPGSSSGNIWDGVTRPEYLKSFLLPEPAPERCRNCRFLPNCTGFTRCPVRLRQCRQAKELELLYDLRCELDRQAGDHRDTDGPEGEDGFLC